jgi:Transposase
VGKWPAGATAESLTRRLMVPVGRDDLLRVVRRRAPLRRPEPVSVLGIDELAWKRGHRSGTVLCDLERRRIVGLLPDRDGEARGGARDGQRENGRADLDYV